jgi:two-component system chemotaxis response regulator CheY
MSKKILLVDDSPTMTMSVKSSLQMNGFEVKTAADGVQALTLLKGGLNPDLIITDINMPNMGGLELIKNVMALPGFRFVPILTHPSVDYVSDC